MSNDPDEIDRAHKLTLRAVEVMVAAYDKDACQISDSDLDNEQPVTIRAHLGDVRQLRIAAQWLRQQRCYAMSATLTEGRSAARPWTPGPWHVREVRRVIAVRQQRNVARMAIHADSIHAEEGRANARLIAAGPDLYEALHEMTSVYWGVDDDRAGDGGDPPACIVRARKALAKAKAAP